MNKLVLPFVLVVLSMYPLWLGGQTKYSLPAEEMRTDIAVTSGEIRGSYSISHFFTEDFNNDTGKYLRLSIPGAFPSGEPGTPALPVFSALVEADLSDGYQTKILSIDSVIFSLDSEFPDAAIFPVQPSAQKGKGRSRSGFVGYSPQPPVDRGATVSRINLVQEGKMRGISIARVQFSPFRYNEERNELTVYYSIEFKLEPEYYTPKDVGLRSEPFRRALAPVIVDDSRSELKRLVMNEPVTMVILSDTLFRESLQPLVQWKTEKGFRVIEAYTSDPAVGSNYQEIRNYMSSSYHQPPDGVAPPSYLLIVGDVEHVPLSQPSGQITDLYYTTFDGEGDYLPEIFHGRISVKNSEELTNVVDKIIMYEKFQFPDPAFLNRTILIAGYDAGYAPVHGNGQINYAAQNYFNAENNILANVYLHPAAASMDEEILEYISQGAALVNYTGHGEYYGWLNPAFRLGHIDTLKNIHKFGLMIGNGCSTNQFDMTNDCFAEAVVKVKERGAVGYIGCTNDSYWDEDYYWSVGVGPITSNPDYASTTHGYYDKLFHMGNEPVEEWAPSLGEMIFAGNMTVQQSTSNRKKYYWEIYQIMGDPSLVPWFRIPENVPVEYPKSIPENATGISVKASAYDYIALSADGVLINALHADRHGQAYMSIPDTLSSSYLKLVITGDYRQPLIDTISRGLNRTGYIELVKYGLNDESTVKDGVVSAGESFSLDLWLVNRGERIFRSGTLLLDCFEDFITITDSSALIGSVLPGDTILLTNAFRLNVDADVADRELFTLGIQKTQSKANTLYLKESVHAPVLASSGITWEDRTFGNGNGIIEPGEKIMFKWEIENSGSFWSDTIEIATQDNPFFSGYSATDIPGIPAGERIVGEFSETINNTLPQPVMSWLYAYASNEYSLVEDSIFMVIGRHYDDFSTGDLSRFNWINSESPWTPDSVEHSGGPWSMRSGNIPHNASTSLQIEFITDQPDSIRFDYKVSSEKDWDFLKFYVDNVLVGQWSGEVDWNQFIYPLGPGKRLLEWRYQKDANTIQGEDAAWVDNVIFPAHVFDSIDLGVLQFTGPASSKSLGHKERFELKVMNNGRRVINGFRALYGMGGSAWMEHAYDDTLQPGEKMEIELPGTFDMSLLGNYSIVAIVIAEGDAYPGNDSLSTVVQHYTFPDLGLRLAGLDTVGFVSADLKIEVTNEGNIPVEVLRYTFFLNNELRRSDSALINLDPGGSAEVPVRLIGEGDMDIGSGWHEYLVVSEEDSVASNNRISGSLFWSGLSVEENKEKSLVVYPNPAGEKFTVQLSDIIRPPVTISFIAPDGRVVYFDQMLVNRRSFNVSEIFAGSGLYYMTITGEHGEIKASGKIRVNR
jgi:hypothetical protein